jgi:hypothetical protein
MLLLAPFVGWPDAKSLVPKSVTTPVAVGIVEAASSGSPPHEQLLEPLMAFGKIRSDQCYFDRKALDKQLEPK